jgi:Sec-independent protein translocase protein TatA
MNLDIFSSVGSQEILMILLVAVIVIGPVKIVNFGKTIGKVSRSIKQTTNEISNNLTKEIELEETKTKGKAMLSEKLTTTKT